jgi:3-deoxy-7-phosphoheptulonate synthase
VDFAPSDIWSIPAMQQPRWDDPAGVVKVRQRLAESEPLVRAGDVADLRALLGTVASGEAFVLQSGDCAEDPEECDPRSVLRKTALLNLLAGTMTLATDRPVLRVGRMGGQFGKPRSSDTERIDGMVLPSYRGHMVNRPAASWEDRRPNPAHILTCYSAARQVMKQLGWYGPARPSAFEAPVWTSHEALLLDYEVPMTRRQDDGSLLLTSTHWPWVGLRTGQPDGAHVSLLAGVTNPVACKIGPGADLATMVRLAARLDPDRVPGRLTFIARMGAAAAAAELPRLVAAVRAAGHPAIWLCDPMHANTVSAPSGLKTRYLTAVLAEVRAFQRAVRAGGGQAGGLHLEATPHDVEECVLDEASVHRLGSRYASFCDPRLNPEQALLIASAWHPDTDFDAPDAEDGQPPALSAVWRLAAMR